MTVGLFARLRRWIARREIDEALHSGAIMMCAFELELKLLGVDPETVRQAKQNLVAHVAELNAE